MISGQPKEYVQTKPFLPADQFSTVIDDFKPSVPYVFEVMKEKLFPFFPAHNKHSSGPKEGKYWDGSTSQIDSDHQQGMSLIQQYPIILGFPNIHPLSRLGALSRRPMEM